MSFPLEFVKCPNCGCKDTVCRLACASEPTIPKGKFLSMHITMIPIQDTTRIATPTTRVLLCHWDICAKCGLQRCTKVDQTTVPTEVILKAMGQAGLMVQGK